MKKYIAFLILVLLAANNCNKPAEADINVEAEILKEMEAQKIPSVVACVVKGDEIVWEGTYGFANVEHSIAPTRESLYTIMSISKLFLATAVMQLWEDGMIDLEADINEYLPFDVRNPHYPDHKITPFMLLTHSSGLAWPVDEDRIPDFHHFYTHEEPPLLIDWLPEYIFPEGSQYRSAVWKDFPPGEQSLYSNIGTSLLALIVEQISGMDYRDFCRENILEPLEMHNSAFRFENLNAELWSTPYTNNNTPMYPYTCRHYPAGFINSNLEDFSHFVIACLNYGQYKGNRILQRSTFEKMLELQNPVTGVSLLWDHYLGDSIGHIGGGTGYSTSVEWHFEREEAMFIFSNKVNSSVYPGGRIHELVRYQSTKIL